MSILFFMAFLFWSKHTPLQAQSCNDAYGMVRDENERVYFVSYNTVTNLQTRLHDFGVMRLYGNPIRKGFLNESAKIYYCLADTETSYETQLISIDVETGNVKSILSLGVVHILDYDLSTGKLYGVRYEDNNTHYYKEIIRVDPEAQTITTLSSFTSHTYYGGETMVIDHVQRKFYLWAIKDPNTTDNILMTFDIETGILLSDVFVSEFFSVLQYNEKDGKCYGISTDNTNWWFSLFDSTTPITQHIAKLPINKLPWFYNAMINTEKNIFLYYGTDANATNSVFQRQYLYSLNLHNGEQIKSVKVLEGPFSYSLHGVPMGSVWHPPGCTTSPHLNPVIHIPNLFTPNNDGVNDMFEIEQLHKGEASLTIYNAWGTLVYSNSAYANSWNAEQQEDGIYYYDLTTLQDQKKYHGWVQVLR